MNFELPLRPGEDKREPVTLRDLSGAVGADDDLAQHCKPGKHIALNAYRWADAMLQERVK